MLQERSYEVHRTRKFDRKGYVAFAAVYDDTGEAYDPILLTLDAFDEMGHPDKLWVVLQPWFPAEKKGS